MSNSLHFGPHDCARLTAGKVFLDTLGRIAMTNERSAYIYIAEKFARLLNEHTISAAEYAHNLLRQSALESRVQNDIARQITDNMPLAGRRAFLGEVRAALAPGFLIQVHIGGPGPGPVRMVEINAEYTKRVQAWASVFADLLGEA